MGNDGGSIAKRAELVRAKKKEVRVESELVAKVKVETIPTGQSQVLRAHQGKAPQARGDVPHRLLVQL